MKFSLGQIVEAIRPNQTFWIVGEEITFEDESVKVPTKKEIADGEAKLILNTEKETAAKEAARSELFIRLGITADEAKLLLG